MLRFLHIPDAGLSRRNLTGMVLFCAILALGAEVRFYTIGLESVDLEEYACVGGIGAPTWSAFFSGQRDLYPYGAPLAPALIYFWSRFAGESIVAIRTLFAIISIVSLVLCYFLAQAVFRNWDPLERRRAGLVAMVCFALSPVHVFHAQEARMYALVSFFAILSMLGMAEAVQGGGRRWWWLNGVANAGLLASHYFTVFLIPVQGLALLFRERRFSRRFVYWCLFQGVLLLGLVLWVSRIPRQAEDLYSYYAMPSISTVVTHLLARDSTTLAANAFFPSSRAWAWLPGGAGIFMRYAHRYFDLALAALSLAAFLGAVAGLLYHARRGNPARAWTWGMLLLWALLPTVLIVAASWLWQPVYGSRYVMYSGLALYLALGGLLARIRTPGVYPAGMLAMVVIFGYQLALAMPPETRTAWRQALEKIRETSQAGPVLLLEDPFWLPVLALNGDREAPLPVTAAFRRDTLCEAATLLSRLRSGDRPVWVLLVLTTDFDEAPFTMCLLDHSLSYDRYFYPGERKLALYQIHSASAQPEGAPDALPTDASVFEPLAAFMALAGNEAARDAFAGRIRYRSDEEGGFWLRLGLTLAVQHDEPLAAAVFQRAVADSPATAFELFRLAREYGALLDESAVMRWMAGPGTGNDTACSRLGAVLKPAGYARNADLLESLARAAVEAAPQCAEGYAFAGLALHQREVHQGALDLFRQAYAVNPKISPEIAEAYGISLAATGASDEAVRVFREGLAVWPDFNWLHMRLGMVYADTGRNAEAVEEYRRAMTPAVANDFYINYLLLQSLLALQRYDEALPLAMHQFLAGRPELWVHLARWRAFVGAGRHEEAEAALKLLVSITPDFQDLYDALYGNPNLQAAKALLEAARKENADLVNELALAVSRMEQRQ